MQIKDYPLKSSPVNSDLFLLQDSIDNSYQSATIGSVLALNPSGAGGSTKCIQLLDKRISGTNGGSFTANTWTPRTVNTIQSDQVGSTTLSSNTFVLPSATYWLNAQSYFYLPNYARMRLQNVTDNVTLLLGLVTWDNNGAGGNYNPLSGLFTVDSSKNLQLQYYVTSTNIQAANLGDASSIGTEIYTTIDLFKVG